MPVVKRRSGGPPAAKAVNGFDWAGIATQRVEHAASARIFGQGDPAACVMYLESGGVRLSVVSRAGKEAVVAVLEPRTFFGEGCLAGQSRRMATATAMADCRVVTIERDEISVVLHD